MKFIDALSNNRFQSYKILCSQPSEPQLTGAYHWNLLICGDLYPFIQSTEIALRNALHQTLTEKFNNEYWFDQIILSYEAKQMVNKARLELHKKKKVYLAPDVVAALTFGFWLTLLENKIHSDQKNPHKLWPQLIPAVFPYYKRGNSERKLIATRFREIKNLRNRLFHHEPIWKFDAKETAEKNIGILRNKFDDIVKAIGWISKEKKIYLREFGLINKFKKNCDITTLKKFQQDTKKNNMTKKLNNEDIKNIPIFHSLEDKGFILQEIEKNILIPVSRIEKWEHFVSIVENKNFLENKKLIFRGHEDPNWSLTSTLNRLNKNLKEKDIKDLFFNFKNSLKEIAHRELHDLERLTENELWALGRHYGLPTPIIDWTYNPMISLYFAFENRKSLYPYHSVYIFDSSKIMGINVFDSRPNQKEREAIQDGCYVLAQNYKNIEQIICNDNHSYIYFRKIYIKANNSKKCLEMLEKKNVSKIYLYPSSIEGVVDYCKTKIPSVYEFEGTIATFNQQVIW